LALTEAKTEMDSKQAEIAALMAQFKVRAETVEYNGYKYERGLDGKAVGFPFCPVCESEGKMIRVAFAKSERCCPRCKAVYQQVQIFGYPQP